jgi:hypothetical protein
MLFFHARSPAPVRNRVRRFFLFLGSVLLLGGAGLLVAIPDATAQTSTWFSGTATPDKLDTEITVSTMLVPAIYNFSFSPSSGWTWYGSQTVSAGLSAQVVITTQWLAGSLTVPIGVTDWFESEYYGQLTPTGTGTTTPITKPWHAYAWDHSIGISTDPAYVRVADTSNTLTREGPTSATLTAIGPDTRVLAPGWSATPADGLSFNPTQGWTTTITNATMATSQPVTVTAQATKKTPFFGVVSDTAQLKVVDVNIAASTVAEKDETTTAVLVPVLAETATSGGVPVSLALAPTDLTGEIKLEKSSGNFDVYSNATLATALISGTQTTATFASASALSQASPVYLKGITASTSTASADTLTLSFTPSAQTGGNTPPEFKDKIKVNVIEVTSIEICKVASGVWDPLPWQQVIRDGDDFKVKIEVAPGIDSLSAFISTCSPEAEIRTFMVAENGVETTIKSEILGLTTENSTLESNSEIRLTIPAADVRNLDLVSKAEDGSGEFCSFDNSNETTGSSNRNDSDAFDSNSTGTRRGLARGLGNINATPPEAVAHSTFFQAAGVICIEVTVMSKTCEKRLIQEQADEFYYSGHGNHVNASLIAGSPSTVSGYWNDIDLFIAAGCSVFDINDYENNFPGAEHTASPGKQWESTGPSLFLGYNYKAPLDDQNSDAIITSWCTNRANLGDIDAWRNANDNSSGRNACAIDAGTAYYYFKKIFPLIYSWTEVQKSEW